MKRRNSANSIAVKPEADRNENNRKLDMRSLKTINDDIASSNRNNKNNEKDLKDLLELVQARLRSVMKENKSVDELLKHTQDKLVRLELENKHLAAKVDDYDNQNKELQETKTNYQEQLEEQIEQLTKDIEEQKLFEYNKEQRYLAIIHKKTSALDNMLMKMQNLNQRFLYTKQELTETQQQIAEKLKLLQEEKNLRVQTSEALAKNDENIASLKKSLTDVYGTIKQQQDEADKMQKEMLERIKIEHEIEIKELKNYHKDELINIQKSFEDKIQRLKERSVHKEKSLKDYFDNRHEEQKKWYKEKLLQKETEMSKMEGFFYTQKSASNEQISLLMRQVDRLNDEIV